jgi:hypothetical protein
MSPRMTLAHEPLDMRAWAPAHRTTADSAVKVLTALGMIASVVAYLSYQDALRSQLKSDQFYSPDIVKPMSYYAAYAVQLTLLLSAGLIAWFSTEARAIQRNYAWRLVLLVGAGLLMTVRGFSMSDLLSTKLVDSTGPLPFILAKLVFLWAPPG